MIQSINPANLELLKTYQSMQPSEVEQIIMMTNNAFRSWSGTTFKQRSELMQNAAKVLSKNKEAYSKLMTLEMGKPLTQSRAEVEKCEWVCKYYAENAERILWPWFRTPDCASQARARFADDPRTGRSRGRREPDSSPVQRAGIEW